MSTTSETASQSRFIKNPKLPKLTEAQMEDLISQISRTPLTTWQAHLHTLAGNVTMEVENEPFEYIATEEDISSDDEDEPWHPNQSVDHPNAYRELVRKAAFNFPGRRVQPMRRQGDSVSTGSQNWGCVGGDDRVWGDCGVVHGVEATGEV